MNLGQRIKEARIQKQMTQKDLVGDYITRNMLSKIENNNAFPSIKTLEYIATQLELSIKELLEVGDSTENPDTNFRDLAESLILACEYGIENGTSFEAELVRLRDLVSPVLFGYLLLEAKIAVTGQNHQRAKDILQVMETSNVKKNILLADIAMIEKRFDDAIEFLLPCTGNLNDTELEYSRLIYAKLEQCYIAVEDYKNAYNYAKLQK